MKINEEKFYVSGMMCESCERKIENHLKKYEGIKELKASYKDSSLIIKYDIELVNEKVIGLKLKEIGYSLTKESDRKKKLKDVFSILGISIVALIILKLSSSSGSFNISESLNTKVSIITLFIIGMLSSLHCVGMCGGIMMSQSITISKGTKFDKIKPAIQYNLGRLISYTVLGAVVGGIGKVVSISLGGQAGISILAGGFMVIMGLNMWGVKFLRKLSMKLPWSKCCKKNKIKAPFVIGLLNGFMPCGPLQTMQLYALGTGSVFMGATSMFFFALGTIPLMLGFGLVSNLLNQNNSNKLMKFSALIVVVLGLSMTNRGLSLIGFDIFSMSENSYTTNGSAEKEIKGNKAEIVDEKQIVRISANSRGYSPKVVYIQKDLPTELIIEGDVITSCNNEIILPSFNIRQKLSKGNNSISFIASNEDINYSCWMGMKRGTLKVVDDITTIDDSEISNESYENEEEVQFYGMPLSKVKTDKLIKSTKVNKNKQEIDISSESLNFEPAVIVMNSKMETRINFDLNEKELDGRYNVYNEDFSKEIKAFEIINGMATVELQQLEEGTYGIVKNGQLHLILEVSSDIDKVDKELIRMKYFPRVDGASCH